MSEPEGITEKVQRASDSGYFRIRWANGEIEYCQYTEGRGQTIISIGLDPSIMDIITEEEYKKGIVMEALQ